MSASYLYERIRLRLDLKTGTALVDKITNRTPQIYRHTAVQFELALFYNGELVDVTDYDSITLDVKPSNARTAIPVLSKTVSSGDLNQSLTAQQWADDSSQHAAIPFTTEETNIDQAEDVRDWWLVISALTESGEVLVLATGTLRVIEAGQGVDPAAGTPQPLYITLQQADARYEAIIDNTQRDLLIAQAIADAAAAQATADAALPIAGGTMTGDIILAGAPSANLHPASKLYVDTADALLLPKAGGTMSGALTLAGAPASNLHAATKLYVDTADALLLPKAGGTMSGALILSGAPTLDLHAATKKHVSDSIGAVLGSPPTDLNTLEKLAAALDNDAAFASTVANDLSNKADLAGDTFTGAVYLPAASPVANYEAVHKLYADTKLPLAGGTMTGMLTLYDAPSSDMHAVNKGFLTDTLAEYAPLSGATFNGLLEFEGTNTAGLRIKNLTATQISALTPAKGMIVYDTTNDLLKAYVGSSWVTIS